jgi:hypothetical protein
MTTNELSAAELAYAEEILHTTAHHEAGHAVAALMRGGGECHGITLEPTGTHWGMTRTRTKMFVDDAAFSTYAGPWADARAQWPAGLPIDEHDDDGGYWFHERVTETFEDNGDDDLENYEPAWENDPVQQAIRSGKLTLPEGCPPMTQEWYEAKWSRELEDVWPVIQALATRLLDVRTMTGDEVTKLVYAGLGYDDEGGER